MTPVQIEAKVWQRLKSFDNIELFDVSVSNRSDGTHPYIVTSTNKQQDDILRKLHLRSLADDRAMIERICPRQ